MYTEPPATRRHHDKGLVMSVLVAVERERKKKEGEGRRGGGEEGKRGRGGGIVNSRCYVRPLHYTRTRAPNVCLLGSP